MSDSTAAALIVSEDWQVRLREAWQALEGKRTWHDTDYDARRAALLTSYEHYKQGDIAKCIHNSNGYVSRLLRYHRYLSLFTMVNKIPERRFYAYWRQLSDPQDLRAMRGQMKREELTAYEQGVFHRIAEMVTAGQPPMPRETVTKVVTVNPPEPHQPPAVPLRPELTPAQRVRARKEVHEVEQLCAAIYPDLKVFARLMKGHGREWAPTVIAWRAERITQSLKALEGYMKGLKFAIDWDSFDADPA